MEKKKLLLVAVSVGVFLAILISASILVFSPNYTAPSAGERTAADRPNAVHSPQPENAPATVDATNMVRNADDLQGIQTPPLVKDADISAADGQSSPSAQAIQENYFYINGEMPTESVQLEKTGDNSAAKVVINVPKPKTAAVPDTGSTVKPAPKPNQTESKSPAVPAPRPGGAKAVKPAEKPSTTSAQMPLYERYWVQTGAFSTKNRAEAARETLASKGITSIIDDKIIDGATRYRVRVGPYTSENEAKYWLSLVKNIDGFSGSQIRISQVSK